MLDTKIRKGTFKHVESELYSYHDTKREIIRLKNDIINSTPVMDGNGGGRSNLPSDPTAKKAATMMTHKRIVQLEEIVDAITYVCDRLPKEKQDLIVLCYWTKPKLLTWEGIADKLHLSRRQAIRWRDEIIYAIAEVLGWR